MLTAFLVHYERVVGKPVMQNGALAVGEYADVHVENPAVHVHAHLVAVLGQKSHLRQSVTYLYFHNSVKF